jgi:hypothetical protein
VGLNGSNEVPNSNLDNLAKQGMRLNQSPALL